MLEWTSTLTVLTARVHSKPGTILPDPVVVPRPGPTPEPELSTPAEVRHFFAATGGRVHYTPRPSEN